MGPVLAQGLVMDLLEAGKLRQDMGREPEEALGLADLAHGDLEVADAPRALELMAGKGQPRPERQARGTQPDGPRPVVVDDRVGDAAAEHLQHPLPERPEEPLVVDGQVLVGGFAFPLVELDPDGPGLALADCGTRMVDGFGQVVIDDQVQPEAAVGPGDRRPSRSS